VRTSRLLGSSAVKTILFLASAGAQAQTIPRLPPPLFVNWANSASASDGAQSSSETQSPQNNPDPPTAIPSAGPPTTSIPDAPAPTPGTDIKTAPLQTQQQKAAAEVQRQEHQRILGVVPNFNTSYVQDAAPLSRKQKFSLAFKSATDVGTILVAASDAAYNEWTDSFPEYGEGMKGYGKYLGASYADTFDGTMLGNALFPALLKQDPRFFRKGTGTFTSRLMYAIGTTFWCKNDNGKRGPNYSNVLGNIAAGGISNLYYPASDRGVGLTFERGAVVTAEGALGGIFEEFWPDIAHKILKNRMTNLQPNVSPESGTPGPSAPISPPPPPPL
jgi:hypothetical protein